jgi:hypothetical protein
MTDVYHIVRLVWYGYHVDALDAATNTPVNPMSALSTLAGYLASTHMSDNAM